jgi:formylglycine-generating enzyme required for sulfatase activity
MNRFLLVILAFTAVLFMVSCGGDGTKDPVDNEPVDNNTVVTDDSAVTDNAVDIEAPDTDTGGTADNTQPDETVDTQTPDTDTGGTGTPGEMVDVPAGEFQMGCNEAVDTECNGNEKPYHAVTLSAYKIGKYEVTVGEYQQCVANGACNNNKAIEPHYRTNTDYPECNLGATGKDNHPMQCVTWDGAKAYCEYIGQRLPTEAEWEKAARGTDGRKYPWGNEDATCDYAVMASYNEWTGEYDCGCGTDSTWPIGSKEAGKSPYGAYDMAGNVWEWVNDRYGETYYETTPTNDPTGPETGDDHVVRGGALNDDGNLRASSRFGGYLGSFNGLGGFRCAE